MNWQTQGLIFLLLTTIVTVVFAATESTSGVTKKTALATEVAPASGYLEAGVDYYNLTDGYPAWFGQYFKGEKRFGAKDLWGFEIHHWAEFDENGTFFGIRNTHDFNEDWYTNIEIGVSDRSFFLQKYSVAVTVYRKLLADKQLVPYLGVQQYWWRTGHETTYVNPGFVYYFTTPKPWNLEAGLYLQRDNPGQVDTIYQYVAVSEGQEKDHYFTLRYAAGREGYLAVGPTNELVNFPSQVLTLTWRQWLDNNWGFNVSAETYHSPNFNRSGGTLGIFKDFS